MFPGMIMPETAVWLCRTVKEPGNATSQARNILVSLLEPTATISARSLWQASDPKGELEAAQTCHEKGLWRCQLAKMEGEMSSSELRTMSVLFTLIPKSSFWKREPGSPACHQGAVSEVLETGWVWVVLCTLVPLGDLGNFPSLLLGICYRFPAQM